MSRRTYRIDLPTFKLLLKYAQEKHAANGEPIPALNKDLDRLESCLNTPFQRFGVKPLYRGFLNKASILFYLLNKNHPLLNGNKRMACLCLLYFCYNNGYILLLPEAEFENLAKSVVTANNENKDQELKRIKEVLKGNLRKV